MLKSRLAFVSFFFLIGFLVPQLSNAQGWVIKWQTKHHDELYPDERGGRDIDPNGTLAGDFYGSGIWGILEYDGYRLYIYNGLTGNLEFDVLKNTNIHGHLRTQPIVIDIDSDGRDEIVLSTYDGYITYSYTTVLEYIGSSVGVNEPEQSNIPKTSKLFQNYPNPFNPETKIEYSLKQSGPVEISIFNQLGQKVRTLIDESSIQPGNHLVTWDGKGEDSKLLASGIYYYQIRTGDFVSTKKAILLK